MDRVTIGVIGGSGVYQIEGLADVKQIRVRTPFGYPSDEIVVGALGNQRIAFFPRHGRGHRIMPSELPVRANIYALKSLGVERIISISAVGSLREDFAPLDIVIPDQLMDRTRRQPNHFLWRRPGRPRIVCRSVLPRAEPGAVRCRAKGRRTRSQRGHAGRHRGAAILHQGRVEHLPRAGRWT